MGACPGHSCGGFDTNQANAHGVGDSLGGLLVGGAVVNVSAGKGVGDASGSVGVSAGVKVAGGDDVGASVGAGDGRIEAVGAGAVRVTGAGSGVLLADGVGVVAGVIVISGLGLHAARMTRFSAMKGNHRLVRFIRS